MIDDDERSDCQQQMGVTPTHPVDRDILMDALTAVERKIEKLKADKELLSDALRRRDADRRIGAIIDRELYNIDEQASQR